MRYSLRAVVDQVLQERGGRPLDLRIPVGGHKLTSGVTKVARNEHRFPYSAATPENPDETLPKESSSKSSNLAKSIVKNIECEGDGIRRERKGIGQSKSKRLLGVKDKRKSEKGGDGSATDAKAPREMKESTVREAEERCYPEVLWIPMDRQETKRKGRGARRALPGPARGASHQAISNLKRLGVDPPEEEVVSDGYLRRSQGGEYEDKCGSQRPGRVPKKKEKGSGRLTRAVAAVEQEGECTASRSPTSKIRLKKYDRREIAGRPSGVERVGRPSQAVSRRAPGQRGRTREGICGEAMSVKAEANRKRTEFWKEKTTSEKKEQVIVEEEEEKKKKKEEEKEEEKEVEGKVIELGEELQEKRERQRIRLKFGVDDAEHEEEEEEAVMIGEEEVQGGRGSDDALSLDEEPLREGKENDLYEQISYLESQVAAMERLVRREHLRVAEEGEGDESDRLRRSERALEARRGPAMGRERGGPATRRCSVYLPSLSSSPSSEDEDEREEVVGGLGRDAGQWGACSGSLRDLEARLSKMEINVLEIHSQMQGRGGDGATCGSQPSYEGKILSSGNEADGGKDMRTSMPRVAKNRGLEKSPVHSSILDMCYRPTFHSSVLQEREMPEAALAEATKLWTTRDGCDTIQSLLTQLQEIQDECSDSNFLASSNGGAWVDREQLANGLNHHPAGREEVKFAASRPSHGSEGTSRDAKNIILREQQLDALEARLAAITSKIRSEIPL